MLQPEVDSFIVLVPDPARQRLKASKDRFAAYMATEFPGYSFKLAAPGEDGPDVEDLTVVPLMGRDEGDGIIRMCKRPNPLLIEAIEDAICAFGEARSLN